MDEEICYLVYISDLSNFVDRVFLSEEAAKDYIYNVLFPKGIGAYFEKATLVRY